MGLLRSPFAPLLFGGQPIIWYILLRFVSMMVSGTKRMNFSNGGTDRDKNLMVAFSYTLKVQTFLLSGLPFVALF